MTNPRTRLPVEHLREWGERLVAARTIVGMTQRRLAAASGCTQQTLSRIERGEVEVGDALKIAIAAALGLPPDFLFPLEARTRWPKLPKQWAMPPP